MMQASEIQHLMGAVSNISLGLRGEILQIVYKANEPICCSDIYKRSAIASDSITVTREVHLMTATAGLLEVAFKKTREGFREVSFYRLTEAGHKQLKQPASQLQSAAAVVQPKTSIPQEITMAKPQGITTAMIKNVAANPGIKIDALHAAIEMLIPGVSLKQVMDISYVTKVIKRVGRGKDAALYLADSVSQPTKKLAPKKPPSTVPAPVAAKQQIVFDPEYRFAFGIRKDGGIAICKDGVSMVLSHNEAQTILAHSSGASHE